MKRKIIFYVKRTILGLLLAEFLFLVVGLFIHLDKGSRATSFSIPSDFSMLNKTLESDYVVEPTSFLESNLENNLSYGRQVFNFKDKDVSFNIEVEESGEYIIYLDYYSTNETIADNLIDVTINNQENDLYKNIVVNTLWKNSNDEVLFDIYSNQVSPMQENAHIWATKLLYDQQYLYSYPLLFNLNSGINHVNIKLLEGSFLLGNIYFKKFNKAYPSYSDYEKSHESNKLSKKATIIEAENPILKSSPTLGLEAVKSSHMTPFSTKYNYLNALSGSSFNQSGDYVTYGFNIEQSGNYEISFKYFINQSNSNTYAKILVDNEILFDDLNNYVFKANKDYKNETLNDNNKNYSFYFNEGFHTITIMLDASNQRTIYKEIMALITQINKLYLEVIKLTNGNVDKNKVWDINSFIPDCKTRLLDFSNRLENMLTNIEKVSKSDKDKTNRLYQQIENAYEKMKKLAKDPNKLPHRLDILSEGNASISKMLANSIHTSTFSPLTIDKIYVHTSDYKLPKATSNMFINQIVTLQRIVRSGVKSYQDKDTINIWVNRSTHYVSLMQQYADAYWTPKTGQKIRFSLLPDESKIIYANASNTIPDAALGVSSSVPYDLGLRGALVDLSTLPGFSSVVEDLVAGSLLNKTIENRVYGLPETLDFQVLFYRTDLISDLGIDIPNTWEDLIKILPELQRYGMNFYFPMSSGSGLKGIGMTAPFIYQYGGNIYSKDYMSSGIDSKEAIEAMNLMVDLFTIYSVPITTSSFYQSFRDGTVPLGIAGFDVYLQIKEAAPEIEGKWALTLPLGHEDKNGFINRTNTSASRDIVIFNKSKKQTKAWEFIKWWMSEEIQTNFANALTQTYGETYLWNTANINAFKNLPIPKLHKEVILETWKQLISVPQIPATYIVERGISDVWNKVVFDQRQIRASISDMMNETNNEIMRKMREFGYLNSKNEIIKPYYVAPVEQIIKEKGENNGKVN